MIRTRVGVLRGGPSSEYDVSLKSGASVLRNLPEDCTGVDIFISKGGTWHVKGVPTTPAKALSRVDVVWNAMHGEYGEDGHVQKMLDELRVPYNGAGVMASMLGFQKHLFKKVAGDAGIRMPRHVLFRDGQHVDSFLGEVHRTFAPPWIVKPAAAGSSIGVTLVKTLHDLPYVLEKTLFQGPIVLVEEYIKGREATCGVIESFRGQELYALLPVEIIPDSEFYDDSAKYSAATRKVCPGNFSSTEKEEIMRLARTAHRAIGARHYSRTDMIVSPRGVYVLEINTLPGFTEESLLPRSLAAVGCTIPQFLSHIFTLAQ